MRRFEVAVLGGGSAAEALCEAGLGGRSVVVIEEARVGGECPFVACMPSKALLHRAARQAARGGARHGSPDADAYREAVRWRDQVVEHLDDSKHVEELRRQGVELLRGSARVVRRGLLEVGGEEIAAEDLVVSTGSRPVLPQIPGLEAVDHWFSDRLLTSERLLESAIVLGGGPVGCELAQLLSRFGCRVTVVEVAEWLLAQEEPELGRALEQTLARDGVRVLAGQRPAAVRQLGPALVELDLQGEQPIQAEALVVATGRRPRLEGLGLSAYGIPDDAQELSVDGHCRAKGQSHLYAIGDVTGVAPFTHTAKYQGRVAAASLRGEPLDADYRAVPRAVYTDPPVAAVGLTREEARRRGLEVDSASFPLSDTARGAAQGLDYGEVVLVADRVRQVLVGAAMAGPGADESIAFPSLAIHAGIPIEELRELVAPFPTYGEAYLAALGRLAS